MKFIKPFVVVLALAIADCQSQSGKKEQTTNPTYAQTIALVFADSSNVTEWHDAPIAQDAMTMVNLSEGIANGNCGKKVMASNNSDQDIEVTVSTVFPFDESPWEMSQKYTVTAGSSVHVGNDKLCFGGREIPFVFKIEGATYDLGEQDP